MGKAVVQINKHMDMEQAKKWASYICKKYDISEVTYFSKLMQLGFSAVVEVDTNRHDIDALHKIFKKEKMGYKIENGSYENGRLYF